MCGICGAAGIDDPRPVEAMTAVQAHRGPDDSGMHFIPESRLALGHRRLSIIDLSSAGHQPMSNDDGSVWIVLNGEIYNFRELRRELEGRFRFRSSTDTEVVLRLYEAEGADFVRRLNGMFAIAIYDGRPPGPGHPRSPNLLLARDRLGIKPLYYHARGRRFLFGSEIKAILASGLYLPDVNWQAVSDYFTYLYVPSPDTAFEGIRQLPPGHLLEVNLGSVEVALKRYWQVEGDADHSTDGDVSQKLRDLLADSVRLRLVSDVPLGVFLSGGIDSAILTGLMAEASSGPVKSYTVVFRGDELELYDERDAARRVADRFGTDHHEIEVDVADPGEMFDLVEFFDQPFGNPTFYLTHLISKSTRSETTVALSGAGGDELFAGYPRYRALALARWARWLPRPFLNGVRWLLSLPRDDHRGMGLRRARQFFDGLDPDLARQLLRWTYFLGETEKAALLGPLARSEMAGASGFLHPDRLLRRRLEDSPLSDPGNRVLHLDIETFLVDSILEYTDKMSMAVGLEVRVPFLDHRVVEHSLGIPFGRKLRGGRTKVVLKEAFADLLPEGHAEAPKKGFNLPIARWTQTHLGGYLDSNMSREETERQGIFDWEYIQLLRQQHAGGRRDNSHELFSIVMFDLWYRKYILGTEPIRRWKPASVAGRV